MRHSVAEQEGYPRSHPAAVAGHAVLQVVHCVLMACNERYTLSLPLAFNGLGPILYFVHIMFQPEAQGHKKRASISKQAVYHSHFVHGTQGAACTVQKLWSSCMATPYGTYDMSCNRVECSRIQADRQEGARPNWPCMLIIMYTLQHAREARPIWEGRFCVPAQVQPQTAPQHQLTSSPQCRGRWSVLSDVCRAACRAGQCRRPALDRVAAAGCPSHLATSLVVLHLVGGAGRLEQLCTGLPARRD